VSSLCFNAVIETIREFEREKASENANDFSTVYVCGSVYCVH